MGCDVKLCLFMPRELTTSLETINKLKRLERIEESNKSEREKLAKELNDKEKQIKDQQALETKKPDEPKK